MKKEQIEIGQVYAAKITDAIVPVRIDAEHERGGWTGTNLRTNRQVRIKSAQKLRSRITLPEGDAEPGQAAEPIPHDFPGKLAIDAAAEAEAADPEPEKPQPVPRRSRRGATGAAKPKKLSALDAAAKVLAEASEPMNSRELIDAMAEQDLWTSDAPTPWATLYSALIREIQNKGEESRFVKVKRGRFALTAPAS